MSKLEKILGMLGSEHEGERASAALLISRMAKERKLSIVEMLKLEFGGVRRTTPPDLKFDVHQRYRDGARVEPTFDPEDSERTILNQLVRCRSKPLNRQERLFVNNVLLNTRIRRDKDLNTTQKQTAEIIIARYFSSEEA